MARGILAKAAHFRMPRRAHPPGWWTLATGQEGILPHRFRDEIEAHDFARAAVAFDEEAFEPRVQERAARLVHPATLRSVPSFLDGPSCASLARRPGGRCARSGPSPIEAASHDPRVPIAVLDVLRVRRDRLGDRPSVASRTRPNGMAATSSTSVSAMAEWFDVELGPDLERQEYRHTGRSKAKRPRAFVSSRRSLGTSTPVRPRRPWSAFEPIA